MSLQHKCDAESLLCVYVLGYHSRGFADTLILRFVYINGIPNKHNNRIGCFFPKLYSHRCRSSHEQCGCFHAVKIFDALVMNAKRYGFAD